jgi:RNA polymerase sigma-70 factor (ECF subfamily)
MALARQPGPRPTSDVDFPAVLLAAQAGESWAWADLYGSLAAQVRGYLRARGANDPDDLLGEVFVHVARRIRVFTGDLSQFRSWVFMVAHHRVIDERRSRGRRPSDPVPPEDFEPIADLDDTETEALRRLGAERVVEMLSCLTPDQRAVLELRFIAGLTIDEIATMLDKPSGAVKALQRRALGALRRAMKATEVSR